MASAGSTMTKRRRPSYRFIASRRSTRSRTWSTTMSRDGERPPFGSQAPRFAISRSSASTSTSGWTPFAIFRHGPQTPQASSRGAVPSPSQFAAWARSLAARALPTPSGPPNRYAWWSAPRRNADRSGERARSCAMSSENGMRRAEDSIGVGRGGRAQMDSGPAPGIMSRPEPFDSGLLRSPSAQRWPDAMNITPLDITQKQCRRTFRGLDPEEVEAFLGLVAVEFEALVKDVMALREDKQRKAEEIGEHRSRERALQETLVAAQKASEEIRESARKRSEEHTSELQSREK